MKPWSCGEQRFEEHCCLILLVVVGVRHDGERWNHKGDTTQSAAVVTAASSTVRVGANASLCITMQDCVAALVQRFCIDPGVAADDR